MKIRIIEVEGSISEVTQVLRDLSRAKPGDEQSDDDTSGNGKTPPRGDGSGGDSGSDDDKSAATITAPLSGNDPPSVVLSRLTQREIAVLQKLVIGDCNKDIAAHLGIGEETVKTHIKNMMRKMRLKSRYKIAAWGLANIPSSSTITPRPTPSLEITL